MTLELLFPHFDELIRTPEDVQRLNEAILQLAVQGKLVSQDPEDEPASELLKRIEAENERQVSDGQIPQQRQLAPIGGRERSLEVPDGWLAVRLGQIITLWNGRAYGRQELLDAGTPIIRIQNLNGGTEWYYSDLDLPPEKYCDKGDLLFAWSGTFGPYIWEGNRSIYHYHIWRIDLHGGLDKQFLYYLLKSVTMTIRGGAHGIMLLHMTKSGMEEFVVPLPPLAEQHRIVAKVDELFAQTRALAAQLRQAQADIVTANRAALHRLHRAQDDGQFQAAWRTLRDHFDLLYNDPHNVADLRQAILDLAVRGKLVPQDAEDEPAGELLKRIEVEKKQLMQEGRLKKQKPLPPISDADAAFELPPGWAWARLPDVGELERGQSKHRPRNDPMLFEAGKYPFVQTGDVARSGGCIFSYSSMYNDAGLAQSRLWPKGTLCVTIAANIGETGILGLDACFPDSVVGFVPFSNFGHVEYVQYFLKVAQAQLEQFAPATAQKNINLGILESLLLPVPPLKELSRIVAKVDQLMRLCDALQAGLVQAEVQRRSLTAAVLSGICRETADLPV